MQIQNVLYVRSLTEYICFILKGMINFFVCIKRNSSYIQYFFVYMKAIPFVYSFDCIFYRPNGAEYFQRHYCIRKKPVS